MPEHPPVRVAVLGAGAIAAACHVPAVAAQGGAAEIVAVADVDPERARGFAAEHGIPAHYDDLAAMLAAEHPDLVVVCTPPGAHADGVLACLEAGAWVWCEKPPTLSLAEYDRIAAAEKEGGPYASYVFQHRFGSGARRLRGHVADGTLGRPLVSVCHTLWYRDDAYYAVPWRGRWETEGGGPSMGHGIHQMDLMLWLLGDWSEVTALTGTLARDVETEDVSLASIRFESGAVASVVNSVLSPRETSYLRFDFERATVELTHLYGYSDADWQWTPAAGVTAVEAEQWPSDTDLPSSHTAQFTELMAAFRAGRRPEVSGADGRRVLELIAGLYQSADSGRAVRRAELTPDNPYHRSMHPQPAAATDPGAAHV